MKKVILVILFLALQVCGFYLGDYIDYMQEGHSIIQGGK